MKNDKQLHSKPIEINTFNHGISSEKQDYVALEEPFLIQIHKAGHALRNLSVMMRTPGNDRDLCIGFAYTEGIIESMNGILSIDFHDSPDQTGVIRLEADVPLDLENLERHFYTSSSCGVCGKAAIEGIHQVIPYLLPGNSPKIDADLLTGMRDALFAAQPNFRLTGGIHATGLFDKKGKLVACREDVGRHNAMDKLIGHVLTKDMLPLSEHVLMVSGRASFELVQKSLMAGAPILVAIGAPSSLAVELSRAHNQTLVGFLKDDSFNIYATPERLLYS